MAKGDSPSNFKFKPAHQRSCCIKGGLASRFTRDQEFAKECGRKGGLKNGRKKWLEAQAKLKKA